MGFVVNFTVKRGGVRQKNVEISYLYKGSKSNLKPDYTDGDGDAKTKWDDIWKGRVIEVYFDGRHKREITLNPRDSHTINLPSGCFPYSTKIHTPFGLRCIGDLSDGDVVLSFDPVKFVLTSRRVIRKLEHEPMRVVEVKTKTGKSLFVTESHSLLTKRGYVDIAKLKHGDHLFVQDDSLPYVIFDEVVETSRVEPVYNLIVADSFNFIADGFVAHSFTTFPKLQEYYWKIWDWSGAIGKASLSRLYPFRLYS